MPPAPGAANPVTELVDSLLTLVTGSSSSTPSRPSASIEAPPVVELDDSTQPSASLDNDGDMTLTPRLSSAPSPQQQNNDGDDEDDEIEIVSAAFVTTLGARPINLDVDAAECANAPEHPTVIDADQDGDLFDLCMQQPSPGEKDSEIGLQQMQIQPPTDAVIDVVDVEAEPEAILSDDDDDEVVVCTAPSRRPRSSSVCHACKASLRGASPLVISRCKHGLCARCALRSVADMNTTADDIQGADLLAKALRPLATCVVPRCNAPLSRAEVDAALVFPLVDDAFAIALAVFHSWRGEDADDSSTGAALIEFPPFSAEVLPIMISNGVLQGVEQLVRDDVATACEPLWVLDEEAAAGHGEWICAACGRYDNPSPGPLERAESSEEDPIDVDDEVRTEFQNASLPPAYPHCAHARALGVYENIKWLARVWEDEKDKRERKKEEEKAKEKEKEAGASGKTKDRRRRSSRKRYTSASTVRSAKRRKTTKKTGFAKGTGYAGSSGSEWKGPSEKLLDEAARLDAEATYWLIRLRCFLLSPSDSRLQSWPGYMRGLLRERRLIAHLAKILINESIMDVLGRIPVFYAALRVVHTLTESPSLRVLITEPCDGDKGRSIAELVESLSRQAALLSTGAGAEGLPESTAFLIKQIRKCIRVINRHNLLQAVRNRNAAVCAVDVDTVEDVGDSKLDTAAASATISNLKQTGSKAPPGSGCFSFEQDKKMYIEQMKTHQFLAVPGLAQTSVFFAEAMRAEKTGNVQSNRQRRIASEVASLFSSLPLSWSSTILLRVDEDRYDFLRACIFGPDGTPYDSGAFIFDIFLPLQYPYVPPKFRLLTTGGGRVRFNPNLYNTGKVCLSLLGTWSGPSWTSSSTILQVLVSIQSLILVPDPYFNEPGFERNVGTAGGNKASALYNARVRMDTALHAIQANVRHATGDLEAGILAHFRLKRRFLTYTLRKWFPVAPKPPVGDPETDDKSRVPQNEMNAAHVVVSADPTTGLSSENQPPPDTFMKLGGHLYAPVALNVVESNGASGSSQQPSAFPDNAGVPLVTFGHGRNFRALQMTSTALETIISDLESIPS